MTSLHERVGFNSDAIDRAADDAEAAFVRGDIDSDVRAKHARADLMDVAANHWVVTPPGLA